jgi:transcriptional regulator with XRE-family HTH domain
MRLARDRAILDLCQRCYTQAEIAERVGCSRTTVESVLTDSENSPDSSKPTTRYEEDGMERGTG